MSAIVIPCFKLAPIPIDEKLPIETFPPTAQPGAMLEKFPKMQSWSIEELVFTMQWLRILVEELITATKNNEIDLSDCSRLG